MRRRLCARAAAAGQRRGAIWPLTLRCCGTRALPGSLRRSACVAARLHARLCVLQARQPTCSLHSPTAAHAAISAQSPVFYWVHRCCSSIHQHRAPGHKRKSPFHSRGRQETRPPRRWSAASAWSSCWASAAASLASSPATTASACPVSATGARRTSLPRTTTPRACARCAARSRTTSRRARTGRRPRCAPLTTS